MSDTTCPRCGAQYPDDHWGEHPQYLVQDWQHEVGEDNTRLGYWDWVHRQIESNEGGER